MTHHQRIAFVRAQQAREHRDGGGLTGSVRTQQAEDFPLLNFERDSVHGFQFAKGFV